MKREDAQSVKSIAEFHLLLFVRVCHGESQPFVIIIAFVIQIRSLDSGNVEFLIGNNHQLISTVTDLL